MRARDVKSGLTLQGYAGTTGVLLAMNTTAQRRRNLLGFAIEREGPQSGRVAWLQGTLRFPDKVTDTNTPVDSNLAPIQKYRWSDYCVYPDSSYRYKLYGVYGNPAKLRYVDGPEITVRTESITSGLHQIIFNRAAAASQAYTRRFGKANPDAPENQVARDWLSRGLRERLLAFLEAARDSSWGVDVAVYEVELPETVAALSSVLNRGAQVRIVYHARSEDPQTTHNEATLEPLPETVKRSRLTSAIFHHKFCVLNRIQPDGSRQPVSILTGSTNFTANAVYRQANVLHVMNDGDIANRYAQLFDRLFSGERPVETRRYINSANPVVSGTYPQVLFSPRSQLSDLREVADIVWRAKRDLVFCTTFSLHDDIETALLGDEHSEVIRYGLQNTRSKITGTHRRGRFVTPAMIGSGLEGFLKESTAGQAGNIFIHLKTIITDFSTARPTVITGSNNFSRNASSSNDENMLLISHHSSVADIYVSEMMRLYDHYRFRFNLRSSTGRGPSKRMTLAVNDQWTERYFAPQSLLYYERVRFCHPTKGST